MRFGIYTPIHRINEKFMADITKSLMSQTYQEFRWVVLLNNGAKVEEITKHIPKELLDKTIIASSQESNIGALKAEAAEISFSSYKADILVELDYDDLLHQECLEVLKKEAEKSEAVFFYSNFAHFEWKGETIHSLTYSSYYGWKNIEHYNKEYFGENKLSEMICFPENVEYMYRIESAPNHVRAFKAEPYREIGGYDASLRVGDDHDLVCRFFKRFGQKGFKHINKCLYYQRIHQSTTINLNREIQEQVDKNYLNHSEEMFLKSAKDKGLLCLDLGGRFNCPNGYKSVDLLDADIIMDLNSTWNIEDNSVGVIRAYHVLEHLSNPIHFFNEAYRVLSSGGVLLIEVPSARDYHAFADPTHKSFWTEFNFEYYTDERKAKFIRPQYKGAFQSMRLVEYPWSDGTLCISAQLIALKGDYNNRFWGTKLTDEKYIR